MDILNEKIKSMVVKDFEIASLLYAVGRILVTHEWLNGVCYFHFQHKEACEKVISDYYNGKVTINAKDLFNALHTIKGILKIG